MTSSDSEGSNAKPKALPLAGSEEDVAEEMAVLARLASIPVADRMGISDPSDGTPLMVAAASRGWTSVVKQMIGYGCDQNVIDNRTGATPLLAAAKTGAASTAAVLIESGADLERTLRANGASALVMASFYGHTKVVKILIGAGANVLLPTRATGSSALFVAALSGRDRVVKLLCNHPSVDPSSRGHDSGATPAYAAAKNGHRAVLDVLAEHGADLSAGPQNSDINMTPVFIACANGHAKTVVCLMDHGVDIAKSRGHGGWSPLHAAVKNGHVHVARALYKRCGFSGNGSPTDAGVYPLHIAAEGGNSYVELVGVLVRRGTSIDLQTEINGETALYLAARSGHGDVVEWLLKAGASVDVPTNVVLAQRGGAAAAATEQERDRDRTREGGEEGEGLLPAENLASVTAVHAAATNGHLGILRMLGKAGADLDAHSEPCGETPAYTAAHDGQMHALELLAELGADVTMPAYNGSTPLFAAAGRGNDSCVRCLAVLGADLNAKVISTGTTAAYIAAMHGHLSVLAVLAHHNAELQLHTKRGDACLQVARKQRHARVVSFLGKMSKLTGDERAAYVRKVENRAQLIALSISKLRAHGRGTSHDHVRSHHQSGGGGGGGVGLDGEGEVDKDLFGEPGVNQASFDYTPYIPPKPRRHWSLTRDAFITRDLKPEEAQREINRNIMNEKAAKSTTAQESGNEGERPGRQISDVDWDDYDTPTSPASSLLETLSKIPGSLPHQQPTLWGLSA